MARVPRVGGEGQWRGSVARVKVELSNEGLWVGCMTHARGARDHQRAEDVPGLEHAESRGVGRGARGGKQDPERVPRQGLSPRNPKP